MTTTTPPPAAPPRAAAEPRPRFADLLAAEWLKLWSLRSTGWSLLVAALAVLAFTMGTSWDTHRYWSEDDPAHAAAFVADGMPLAHAFTTNAGTLMMLAMGAFGALAVTGEYSSGQIRTTFAAVPARRSVMAAKTAVVAAVTAGFGAFVAGVSFAVTQAVLGTLGAGVPLDHPGALRVVAASALLAPVAGLAGVAIGAVVRHGAGAVVGCVVVLLLLPLLLSDDRHWSAVLGHTLPYQAWLRLTDVPYGPAGLVHPWSVTGAWTVYALWAVVAAAVAVAAVHRRDQ
ncbi:ABC transporter permease [Streptomyces genisteinicus]|uniref:ABC transporter permease n=1 Tax=Streptomyces genisteinicus TaxID=2768068 RepID=A0A7H0HZU2_9ACTN|nr:ABC transporter permease [Streptomyces genisteinicus]QNP66058.1 ABC transporter permease [Streptomyces genisteinicus]